MMPETNKKNVALASFLVCLAACQMAEAQQPQPGRLSFLSPSNLLGGFDDLVTTGKSELGGDRVGVNVPGIVHLKLDRRPNMQGARMELSVLSGMVRVNLDRVHHADGTREGPIEVRFVGIPMYVNQEARQGVKPREPSPLENTPKPIPNLIPQINEMIQQQQKELLDVVD